MGKAAQPPAEPLEVVVRGDATLTLRDRARGGAEQSVSRSEMARLVKEAQTRNPQQAVLIAADKSVRYEVVMQVMDELQQRQVTRIGLLVRPGK